MTSPSLQYDIAIIGSGPAGLFAAIAAAQNGARVVLLEQLPRPSLKLLASGGGHCNLSNTLPPDDFMARLGRQGRFIAPALDAMSQAELLEFFQNELDVPTACPDGFHIFPASNSAAHVQEALWRKCQSLGVKLMLATKALSLQIEADRVVGVVTSAGPIAARAVILACGGKSYPQLGATGTGYVLARQAGHAITDLLPAMVALIAADNWIPRCAGVTLADSRVWIDLKGQPRSGIRGNVLFTHTGVSGPAVLDISGDVAALLVRNKTVPLRIALSPDQPAAQWLALFDQWQQVHGSKHVLTMVDQHVPHSLAAVLCELAHLPPQTICSQFPRASRDAMAKLLEGLPLTIRATEGFDKAMVTRGGVKLSQVEPHTMASKLAKGLYFAGEILDLDGPCGGYNLQLAFSTGYLAGAQRRNSTLNNGLPGRAIKKSASGRPCPDAHP